MLFYERPFDCETQKVFATTKLSYCAAVLKVGGPKLLPAPRINNVSGGFI
jgi:hypothetical protein